MIKKVIATLIVIGFSSTAFAGAEDDPLLYKVMIDQLEVREAAGSNPLVWDAEAWVGKDLNKLWFKTEGERVNGKTAEADVQFLYSRAIATFWDFQAGWRRDTVLGRDWLAFGFKGLTPYQIDVDANLFVGESGLLEASLDAEYEYMITQKLVLSPEIEVAFHNKDDRVAGIGSGLSAINLGLRLSYEARREFAPYIGINLAKKFGQTANFAEDEGEDTSDTQLVVGIRIWF